MKIISRISFLLTFIFYIIESYIFYYNLDYPYVYLKRIDYLLLDIGFLIIMILGIYFSRNATANKLKIIAGFLFCI
jgi:hypothetical protein